MSATLFIPMPEWQALLFLRDRRGAFDRLLLPSRQKERSEVSPTIDNDGNPDSLALFAFRNRRDAIKVGYDAYPDGFAMLRVVIAPLTHGNMVLRRQLTGASEADSRLYRLNREGLMLLRDRCLCKDVEVMVDQIFAACIDDRCVAAAGCGDAACRGESDCDEQQPALGPDSQSPDKNGRPSGKPGPNRFGFGS